MIGIKCVECNHSAVIEEGKDIVRAAYVTPPPTLGHTPRETVHLFVPEDERTAPSWSFAQCPWVDSPEVEGAWRDRCVFCHFERSIAIEILIHGHCSCPSVHFFYVVGPEEQAKIIREAECEALAHQEDDVIDGTFKLPSWHSDDYCDVGGCPCRYPSMPLIRARL